MTKTVKFDWMKKQTEKTKGKEAAVKVYPFVLSRHSYVLQCRKSSTHMICFGFQKPHLKRFGRLYAKATFTGYKRGLRNQHENTALLKVGGCVNKQDSWFYVGKKCVFVYRVSV